MARLSNPFAFTRWPVTLITCAIYLAVFVILLVVHTGVPAAPQSATPIHGVNLTEAWRDLQHLTAARHPYNSRPNDAVHDWLLHRVEAIIADTAASPAAALASPASYVFEDNTSNLTFSSAGSASLLTPGISVYFEGTNLIVYVRGSDDDQATWWRDADGTPTDRNAVLVNAHYDSVSTGFGATDDGVGVICVLQLLRYFTTPGHAPRHGVVLLMNNGEEDFLNGASVFGQHPMSQIVGTFLNLEGAGAGGRAALFRSTDYDVTQAYARAKYPFGSSTSADGFNRGLIRSQTDYVVFNGKLGYRGLDVAFIGPRARYHTEQDDARHTGKDALWHMLSAAVATTQALTSAPDRPHAPGGAGLWFDLFGRVFVLVRAHTFFALSVTLLVAGPIVLLLTLGLLYRVDKLYLWSGSRPVHTPDGDDVIRLYGWRGFFRYPAIMLAACATPLALAYLTFKENPYIAHSSEWAVWSMMASSFVFVAWFLCRAADFGRPSSLTRAYGLSWMWTGWWTLLVAATVLEEHVHLVGTYFVWTYAATTFLATWIAYLELFSLPQKSAFCRAQAGDEHASSRSTSSSRARQSASLSRHGTQTEPDDHDEDEPTERSSLLRSRGRSTFKGYGQVPEDHSPGPAGADPNAGADTKEDVHQEQEWSKSQWSSLWLVQMVVLVPLNLIIVGQMALLTTEGLHQTGQDGSSMFLVYLMIAVGTILLFSPLVPFLHRFTWHVPMFLLLVLIGTAIYNLTAFPFSPDQRVKLFFQQQVDLDRGNHSVALWGVPPYVRHAVDDLPSAAGQHPTCVKFGLSDNLEKCSWTGLGPRAALAGPDPSKPEYRDWLNYTVTKVNASDRDSTARFVVSGKNTRACKLTFDRPIQAFHVDGQAPHDPRFDPVPSGGSGEIRLWSRTWDRAWTVNVSWDHANPSSGGAGPETPNTTLSGKVVCLWSDINQKGIIPAFDEAVHYVPDWVAVTKGGDGLVEGYKRFLV